MVFDIGEKKSTVELGMRGRVDARKVDSRGGNFTGVHDGFPTDPIYRESQLAIGWTEQECKEMDELAKENHTYCLTAEEKRRYQNQWYFTLNKSGKNGPMNLDQIFELLSKSKIVYTTNQGNKLKSLSIEINAVDGPNFQEHRGGTSLNGIGGELLRFFKNITDRMGVVTESNWTLQ